MTASDNAPADETSEEGTEGHEEGEAAEGAQEEAHADEAAEPHTEANETSETILGINPESTTAVAAAVVISLLLAAALYYWGTPATLIVAGVFALLFAALDLRELAHQLSEGRSSLVVLALLAAVLHAGVAVVAGLALTRAPRQLERHRSPHDRECGRRNVRQAEKMRMIPSPTLSTAAGIAPTSSPPMTAPITDPSPIGATVSASAVRS